MTSDKQKKSWFDELYIFGWKLITYNSYNNVAGTLVMKFIDSITSCFHNNILMNHVPPKIKYQRTLIQMKILFQFNMLKQELISNSASRVCLTFL